jgi:3-deoxy-D-manno-octulosonic-acid transferase
LFVFLYNIFLLLFRAGTHIASLFNPKAKKWVRGRHHIFEKLEAAIPKDDKIIWMHCASLGEFEQGRPVLEKLKGKNTAHKVLLTFFSPSGYEVQKNYSGADWVFYLPMDGSRNARRFLEIVHPSLVIFVKYEFWYYYLKKISYREIPFILISAVFRKEMRSFKWLGELQLKMLSRFNHIFLQNESSKQMLDELGAAKNYSVAGDTRFDRVIEIADNFKSIESIEKFCDGKKVLVAGSTWSEDEAILSAITETLASNDMKLIIAPHEIHNSHIQDLKLLFPKAILFSELKTANQQPNYDKSLLGRPITSNQLIIDNVGMLSRLYHYADICFVGGGFKQMGVHNVTEAAVYGKPVLMGPFISKYREAVELVKTGGGSVVNNAEELNKVITELLDDKTKYHLSGEASFKYIRENAGAVNKILSYIQVNRLLTN